jgi:hypothetical protein
MLKAHKNEILFMLKCNEYEVLYNKLNSHIR